MIPALLSALLTACTVESPTTGPGSGNPDPMPHGQLDFKPPPPADMAHPDDGRAEPPILDAIPQLTAYDSIPVHGTAEVGASVLIKATDGSTVSADVLSSGRFCADVPLKKSVMNDFELRTIDANGNTSDPVMLHVMQSGTPQQAPGGHTESQNMAIGGATSSSLSWNSGNPDQVHDSNPDTYAGSWQRALHEVDYITVQLSDRRSIDHIRIRAPQSCPLTAQFTIFVSNADAPSDPGTTPMSWASLQMVPTGAAGTDYTVTLSQPTPLTHVSLYFDRGLIAFGDDDINCGNEWTWGAYYAFSEIEAWSAENAIAPPPNSAPTCTSGGD